MSHYQTKNLKNFWRQNKKCYEFWDHILKYNRPNFKEVIVYMNTNLLNDSSNTINKN